MLIIEQVAQGINPFDVIECPLCDCKTFVSVDHASVWCQDCNARFTTRHTAGDPGFVVDCHTEHVYKKDEKIKHAGLIGMRMYRIVKTHDTDSGWLVMPPPLGLSGLEEVLSKLLSS